MKQILFILLVFISFQGFSQSVKIRRCDSLEVMKTDLVGKMTWEEAKKACEKLGDGWRLPTIEELQFMYNKRDEIGGFESYPEAMCVLFGLSNNYLSIQLFTRTTVFS